MKTEVSMELILGFLILSSIVNACSVWGAVWAIRAVQICKQRKVTDALVQTLKKEFSVDMTFEEIIKNIKENPENGDERETK
jgi:hypothetical protein